MESTVIFLLDLDQSLGNLQNGIPLVGWATQPLGAERTAVEVYLTFSKGCTIAQVETPYSDRSLDLTHLAPKMHLGKNARK